MKMALTQSGTSLLAVSIALLSQHAYTQPFDKPQLEEVIVTSQKRAQSLQDVPISIVAVSGDQLNNAGVENIEDLQVLIPNIHLTETGIGTQLRVRGIGSGINQGFEQSVGVYVDGIYYSRAQLFRAPIFDMERIEVMRGPQGIIFGKNSAAGALDMVTAKPTDEFEAKLTTSYESEFETAEVTGIVSGPITDSVRARLALRAYEDEGYIVNTFKNEQEPFSEENSVRLTLGWDVSDRLEAIYTGEYHTFDNEGRQIEIIQDLPNPNTGANYNQISALIFDTLMLPGFVPFEANLDFNRQANAPEFSTNEINSHRLKLIYDWNDITITSVTGYVGFESDQNCDCDYVPLSIFELGLFEKYDQVSQEIRFTSSDDAKVRWIAGLFLQNYDQDFNDEFRAPADTLLVPASQFASAAAAMQGINQPALPNAFASSGISRNFDQTSDTWAIFAEFTFDIEDNLQLAIGGRFTQEKKEATRELNIVDADGSLLTDPTRIATLATVYKTVFRVDTEQTPFAVIPAPGGPVPLFGANNPHAGHSLEGDRDESSFTPSIKLLADLDENTLGYISFATGFKAGGFDPRSNSNVSFEFEEETADSLEIGFKTKLADGRGDLNLAWFRADYEDIQISQFDGSIGFTVGNARGTQTSGVELDGRWAFSDEFTARYALSYLDFEYTSFENGNCNQENESTGQDLNGDGILQCSFTGLRGILAPYYTLNVGLDYIRSFGSLTFLATTNLQHVDEHNAHVNLSQNGVQDSYNMLSLRVGLEGEHWSAALRGNNLLDEEIISFSANAPLSGSQFGSNTLYAFVRRPQTLTAELTVKF